MKQPKTTYLILILACLLIILAGLIMFKPARQPSPAAPNEKLRVIGVSPKTTEPLTDRYQPLEITLNQPLIESSVNISLVPNHPQVQINFYRTKLGPTTIQVVPQTPWTNRQTYKLILNKFTQSPSGAMLDQDVIINFNIEAKQIFEEI